jgi:glutathione S-transferase
MKLYYAPGSCALSPHIVGREAGLPLELSKVTFAGAARTTAEGEDFFQVNPRGGYVPTLRLDDGDVLIEGPAIIHYLADQAPEKLLLPERGSKQYYEALSWVAFISTELHKAISPFFGPPIVPEVRTAIIDRLKKRYAYVESWLAEKEYVLDTFSIADAYLYTIMRWSPKVDISTAAEYPHIHAFMKRMEAREGVMTALTEEGLEPMGV